MKTAEQLDQEILSLIARGLERRDDDEFDRLARGVFEYQFARNMPYRRFCLSRGAEPARISSWKQIPAVPTSAFKDATLTCFPVEQAAAIFETSGTTQSYARRGRHYLESTDLYRASIVPNFAEHLLPDRATLPLLLLMPSPEEAPRSSLSFMMGVVAEVFGRRGVHYFIQGGRLDAQPLHDSLRMAEQFDDPVFLLGTAFAFVHFFERCAERGWRFQLPSGSRAMETGGFKGRSREMDRDDLYACFEDRLGIPVDHVVNEYGMTELAVQFYDRTLRGEHSASTARAIRRKTIPPWSRLEIIDPSTGEEAAEGTRGLIRVFDLTNRGSVMAIQTEDVGVRVGAEFEVFGRAAGAEARGCSIAADEFLAANR